MQQSKVRAGIADEIPSADRQLCRIARLGIAISRRAPTEAGAVVIAPSSWRRQGYLFTKP